MGQHVLEEPSRTATFEDSDLETAQRLACDGLDIPLQAALQAQHDLMQQFDGITKKSAYDLLIDALQKALKFVLGRNGS